MKRKKSYISIFSGCGGLSLGFKNSEKWSGLFAVEKSEDAYKTLDYNLISKGHYSWVDWLEKKALDIGNVLKNHKKNLLKMRGAVDLVAGGPPCQGFSIAGKRREDDTRNMLVDSYIQFIRLVQPQIVFFENVKGFAMEFNKNKRGGRIYSDYICKKLSERTKTFCGYDVAWQMVNFSDYGIPQNRIRFILIGFRKNSHPKGAADEFFKRLFRNREKFLEDKGLLVNVSLKSSISDLTAGSKLPSPDSSGFYSSEYKKATTNYQKHLRRNVAGYMPDSHRFANHKETTKEKLSYFLAHGTPGKSISNKIKRKFNLKKRNMVLLAPEKASPTLTAMPDDYIHYSQPRILTVREYARIQSFDDCYQFKGRYTTGGERRKEEIPRYTQIGNAIPPLFAEAVATEMDKML
jgi:DNA (cytosine-5)-methyltransferase 1